MIETRGAALDSRVWVSFPLPLARRSTRGSGGPERWQRSGRARRREAHSRRSRRRPRSPGGWVDCGGDGAVGGDQATDRSRLAGSSAWGRSKRGCSIWRRSWKDFRTPSIAGRSWRMNTSTSCARGLRPSSWRVTSARTLANAGCDGQSRRGSGSRGLGLRPPCAPPETGAGQRPGCSANGSHVTSAGRSAGAQRMRSLTRPW
jgi:hypothetical protein